MKFLKVFFLIIMINTPLYAALEKDQWIRLTCFGPTTPRIQMSPSVLKFTDLISIYYLKSTPDMPSIEELRNLDFDRFAALNNKCHTLRWQKMDLSNFPANYKWLDWDTDYLYAGFKLKLESYDKNLCRKANQPCVKTSDCCKTKLVCDGLTATCVSTYIKYDPTLTTKDKTP